MTYQPGTYRLHVGQMVKIRRRVRPFRNGKYQPGTIQAGQVGEVRRIHDSGLRISVRFLSGQWLEDRSPFLFSKVSSLEAFAHGCAE